LPDDFGSLELLAWRVEQGRPDPHNPLVEPKMPWDLGGVMAHGTVLRDPIDGRWKAWQISTPPSRPYGPGTWTYDRRLTYLESEDGVTWRRPALALIADGGVRVLGRRTSRDGIQWSDPTELLLTPDWRDPGDTQFMELNPLPYPGGYIGTVAVYHNHTQTIDLQWAASRDAIRWWRPDRRPALPNGPLGDHGGGMIWPTRSLVLDGRRLHVYYGGTQGLHGDMYNTTASGPRRLEARGESLSRQSSSLPDHSALCRATWQAHRLWALAPAAGGPYVGQAVTHRRPLAMTELRVNVLTRPDGDLRVEVLDAQAAPVPGFTADDCEPVRGDHEAIIVKWKQNSVLPERATKLRFLLRQAYLYGFDTTGAPAPK
jgi:hypothetical protein